ncbi:uncharacterized protein LOC122057446 isoform X2 [Macadamia integrifolia]|uniref:uncharacterized protein LOC122057446 isoform X2 n=1 Tax=Macadamia integrifolia TaxID=60698 RepID=UPI001C527474|nr:uncharacterized protein LOC122057446 isoform X2 [Macadamia integrifolia]
MELSLSGNSLKTFARCITCLARIGHELAIEASPSQLAFHALNSSRSAYQAITFKPHFFDVYTIIAAQVRCSVLLKAVCSVLRTPVASVDHLSIRLPNSDASKVQWTLDCLNEESDAALHTQLWIDPIEEFLQYTHSGDPVDVTFAVKELKAFLTFCEGCEVDIHLFFEKAGEPILMAPKFGLDDGSNSDFDATLFLATMLASQLHEGNLSENPPLATNSHCQADQGTGSQARRERFRVATSEHPSDHTKIWSELSGSAKSGNGAEERHVQVEMNSNASGLVGRGRANAVDNSNIGSAIRNMPDGPDLRHPVVINHEEEPQDRAEMNNPSWSQHHRSNWVGTGDDDDEEDEDELLVQPTPPC